MPNDDSNNPQQPNIQETKESKYDIGKIIKTIAFADIESLKKIISSDKDFIHTPIDKILPWVHALFSGKEEVVSLLYPGKYPPKLGNEVERIVIPYEKNNDELKLEQNIDCAALHFIWLGGPLPEKYLKNIEGFCKIAQKSGYKVNLWMEDGKAAPNFSEDTEVKIRLISELGVRKALEHSDKGVVFDQALRMETALGNWGSASDILRLEILRQFGGVYLDTDHLPNLKAAEGEEVAVSVPKTGRHIQPDIFPKFEALVTDKNKSFFHKKMHYGKNGEPEFYQWSNDILAAYPDNQCLTEYLSWSLGNYNEHFKLLDIVKTGVAKGIIGDTDEAINQAMSLSIIHHKLTAERGRPIFFALTGFTTGGYTINPLSNGRCGLIPTTSVPFDSAHLAPGYNTDLSYTKPQKNEALDVYGFREVKNDLDLGGLGSFNSLCSKPKNWATRIINERNLQTGMELSC